MTINWKVRLLSPAFWLAAIPALLLLVQAIFALFGVTFDIEPISAQLLAIVDAAFVLLMILGIVTDHTTRGLSDSTQALSYAQPRKDDEPYVPKHTSRKE